jgi:hypothetical protein
MELLLLQMRAVCMLSANMTSLKDQTCRTSEARDTNRYEWFQINQPTRCKNFSSLLLDVYSYVPAGPATTNSTATTTLQW